ncbi:MAG: QueT transporter family protein [Oscillospiraceae bacterium]|jgi:uncharacterized membrane protein|nr:QueT transporter family protein [Oscillospiraceae bacterium]
MSVSGTFARKIAFSGVIAALYTALVFVTVETSFGFMQFRAAEALTLLPFLFPEAVPGLFIGCMLSNFLSRYGLMDVVIGSSATLLAAVLTAKCKNRWLAALPPVLVNALAVGVMIALLDPGLGWGAAPFCVMTVGLGQAAACFGLGVPLTYVLEKTGLRRRLSPERRQP